MDEIDTCIRDGGGARWGGAGYPNNNFRRTKLTPTNHISLEREFNGEYDSF